MEGTAQPGGRVAVRAGSTAAHEALIARLLDTLALPDDVRVWAMVTMEDGTARLTVRAGAADVIGEATVDLPPALAKALDALIDEVSPRAKADLKHGIAKTLAAPAVGRDG